MKKRKSPPLQKKSTSDKKPNNEIKTLLISMHREISDIAHDIKMVKIEQNLNKANLSHSIFKVYERINETRSEILVQIRNLGEKIDTNVMEKLDSIMGDIKKFDEDRDIVAYRQSNHGERIEKIETAVFGKTSE